MQCLAGNVIVYEDPSPAPHMVQRSAGASAVAVLALIKILDAFLNKSRNAVSLNLCVE